MPTASVLVDARDAAGDHDRRAELAERPGESEDRPADHGGTRQRQGDREEDAHRAGPERRRRRLEPPVHLLDAGARPCARAAAVP